MGERDMTSHAHRIEQMGRPRTAQLLNPGEKYGCWIVLSRAGRTNPKPDRRLGEPQSRCRCSNCGHEATITDRHLRWSERSGRKHCSHCPGYKGRPIKLLNPRTHLPWECNTCCDMSWRRPENGKPCRCGKMYAPEVIEAPTLYGSSLIIIRPVMGDMFAVELDGFEYHSSKSRFTLDRQNDRRSLVCGVRVVRFSGPEIFESPGVALDELIECCKALDRQSFDDWGIAYECGVASGRRTLPEGRS